MRGANLADRRTPQALTHMFRIRIPGQGHLQQQTVQLRGHPLCVGNIELVAQIRRSLDSASPTYAVQILLPLILGGWEEQPCL